MVIISISSTHHTVVTTVLLTTVQAEGAEEHSELYYGNISVVFGLLFHPEIFFKTKNDLQIISRTIILSGHTIKLCQKEG